LTYINIRRNILDDMPETPHPIEMEEERIEVPDIAPAFAPDGMVAQALGQRYRYRAGQAEMAQLVRQSLIEGRPALLEAGTGCGKSFAYLIPVIASGARAFVSTANKTLQTQLWEKDIPTLRKVSPRPFTAALLKGRANYICHLKLQKAQQQLTLPGQEQTIADLAARIYEAPRPRQTAPGGHAPQQRPVRATLSQTVRAGAALDSAGQVGGGAGAD